MTDDELDAIERRYNAATPEYWTVTERTICDGVPVCVLLAGALTHIDMLDRRNDMDAIVSARSDIPALIAEVRRLREENGVRGSLLAECLLHDMRHLPSCSYVHDKATVCDCGLYTLVGKIDRIIR